MKRTYFLLMLFLTSGTAITPIAYAKDPNSLTDQMQPVGNHTIPASLLGGPSTQQDLTPENSDPANTDFRPGTPDNSNSTPSSTNNLKPHGNILMDQNGASIYPDEDQVQKNNSNTNGLVALPNRKNEDENAEMNEALRNLIPPTSSIHEARRKRAELEKEDASPIGPELKPLTRTINMTLRPGEIPPTIHLALGAVTTLTFSDVTGSPWYVGNVVTDESSYRVTKGAGNDDVKSNIVTIYPITRYSMGRNISIMLEHASVPVILQLDTAMRSNTVDYRADVTVMQRGPNAREDFIEDGLAPAQDSDIQGFVDGIAPHGAKSLRTDSSVVEAWKFKGMMYIRTNERLMSPIWIRKSHSDLSGNTVYVLRPVPNVTISSEGNLSSVMIKQ